jgi:alpha-ketoglutarate-dependent sulfate ester dioxygenase
MPDTMIETETGSLEVVPIGGRIGALVRGVQLSGDMPAGQVRAIRAAMLRHKVVFLRDQRSSDADREAFAELLGEPVPYDYVAPPEGTNYSWQIDSLAKEIRNDQWHTDLSWLTEPVEIGILAPVELPEYGGDTVWANTAAAYDEMPEPLKAMADQLWAVHSPKKPLALTFANPSDAELAIEKRFAKERMGTRHPVVRIHPETGEKVLLLGNIVYYFEGFTRTPGQHIFELLHHYITRPENVIRWHWRLGDVAIWDNRATQHYGVRDYDEHRRVMRRISLRGSVPRSVDGQSSTPVD